MPMSYFIEWHLLPFVISRLRYDLSLFSVVCNHLASQA